MRDQFFDSGKRHKFAKITKPAVYKPYFFRVYNSYPAACDVLKFQRRKFKKITNKAVKTAKKNIFIWVFIIQG